MPRDRADCGGILLGTEHGTRHLVAPKEATMDERGFPNRHLRGSRLGGRGFLSGFMGVAEQKRASGDAHAG